MPHTKADLLWREICHGAHMNASRRISMQICRALLQMEVSLLCIHRALLWMYRALLRIYRALLQMEVSLLWIHRALLRIYRALLRICRALLRMEVASRRIKMAIV